MREDFVVQSRSIIRPVTKQIVTPQGAVVYFSLLLGDLTLGDEVKVEQFSIYGVGRYPPVGNIL